jgi:PPOX class probable F420-dependent enzyme
MASPLQPPSDHVAKRLRDNVIIWFSTVRPDGRPHLVPVWFLWQNGTILIFSKSDQKIRNLRANPRVMMALDDTQGGDDVVLIEGMTELIEGIKVTTSPEYLAKYSAQFQGMHWTAEAMEASYTQALRITPTRFLGV